MTQDNKPFILCFRSRGLSRLRYETIRCRDKAFADILGEARANKRWIYLGIVPERKKVA